MQVNNQSQVYTKIIFKVNSYFSGHLSRAFHLDCSLMLQDPAAFSTACSALIAFQQSALTAQASLNFQFFFCGLLATNVHEYFGLTLTFERS